MDLVFMVRNGEVNNELRASLRSIAKFAPPFDKIVIVGYKPSWVSDIVSYIPTVQTLGSSKNKNTNMNLLTACKSPIVSDNFILMNDDFILTRPIKNWDESLSKVKNSIKDQISEYNKQRFSGLYKDAFDHSLSLIQKISELDDPMNYELHLPMVINKKNFINLFEMFAVQDFIKTHKIILKRSLYGNCFLRFKECCEDVKLRCGDPDSFDTDWISLPPNFMKNSIKPKFNKFINKLLPEKCKYEKE